MSTGSPSYIPWSASPNKISTMCSLFLFVIFSCYDQYERRNIPSKRGAFKRMKYTSKKVKNDMCAVCLEEFHSKEKIGLCHCQHGYHVKCISTWLQSKSKCPMCNAQVSDDTNKPYTRAASAQLVSPLPTR